VCLSSSLSPAFSFSGSRPLSSCPSPCPSYPCPLSCRRPVYLVSSVCCSVLQLSLQGGAVCLTPRRCITVCCGVLQCVAVCCSVFQCAAVCADKYDDLCRLHTRVCCTHALTLPLSHTHTCVYVYMNTCTCIHIYIYVYMYLLQYIHIYVYMFTRTCMYVYIHVCAAVCCK